MDNIIIPVSKLIQLANELTEDQMDFVQLSILESDEIDGEYIPPCLSAVGFEKSDPDFGTDYDTIDAVEDFIK